MKAAKNTVVSLTYRLTENDANGTLIEEVNETQPFTFVYGAGNVIPGFEQNLHNLSVGDGFAFDVKAIDGYGEYDPQGVVDLPLSVFQNEGVIDEQVCKIGNIVPMQNNEGQHFSGVITAITDTNVTMDFNHPLAGMDLHFQGSVVDIREATPNEIEKGHVHQDNAGEHSCGCGC